MEDMDTSSFALFGQNLWTVDENDERSPLPTWSSPLPARRQGRSGVAQHRSDEHGDVVFKGLQASVFTGDCKSHPDSALHEDETMSSYDRDGRNKSKRVASTSSKSRMSAIKKRGKICLEKISEANPLPLTPLGSGKQLRRNLFHSDNNDDIVASPNPLVNSSTDASYRHSSSIQTPTSLVWKKHSSLPEETRRGCQSTSARFPKCHSEAEFVITSALSRSIDDQNLIGDYSRPCRLPVISGKHQDLKAISHETMTDVLNGGYSGVVEEYIVVDCRYPYEYEAGHITGARNIYSKDEIIRQFLTSPPSLQFLQRNPVLIFHCEFSSERGPKLLRYLRNRDRSIHQENYPALFYPEMYLLEGGYKEFCQWHLNLCEPQGYLPMIHSNHTNELAYYRSKSRLYTSKQSLASITMDTMEKQGKFSAFRC